MTDEEFGKTAGRRIVVEKKLEGEECGVLAQPSAGESFRCLRARIHKAVFDGDTGPTGGMGVLSGSRSARRNSSRS